MKLQLNFSDINTSQGKQPEISVTINDHKLYQGVVQDLDLTSDVAGPVTLCVHFVNKTPTDTVVDSAGNIVADLNFTLKQLIVDGLDFQELIWRSNYHAQDGQIFPSCLFFGPPGRFQIQFELPVLRWCLRTRHELNNNDPDWEEDYNYYIKACEILAKL